MLITCRLASIIEEASEEVRFAEGSPLEGDGFEPLVPHRKPRFWPQKKRRAVARR